MGFSSVDVGSVKNLRKVVNKKLTDKGGRKLKGYKSVKILRSILKSK